MKTPLVQQTPGCSDFDVSLTSSPHPDFRVLLPEWIFAEGLVYKELLHIIPGHWEKEPSSAEGTFRVSNELEIRLSLRCESKILSVKMQVTNLKNTPLSNVWANICSAVNHFPGNPGWCNRRFIGALPDSRELQGRAWYETISPSRLKALTASGWIPMHPHLEDPAADKVPLYGFTPSPTPEAWGCAIQSLDGSEFFFHSWSTLSRWCTPCPGNACMHLEPFIADRIEPGQSASIQGLFGLHPGDWSSLARHLQALRPTK